MNGFKNVYMRVEQFKALFRQEPGSIVISGPPGVGKTSLGAHLSNELNIPLIGFDLMSTSLRNGAPYDFSGSDDGKTSDALQSLVHTEFLFVVDNYVHNSVHHLIPRIEPSLNKDGVSMRNTLVGISGRTEHHHQKIDDYDMIHDISRSSAKNVFIITDADAYWNIPKE